MTNWEDHYQRAETPWDKQAAHPFLSHPTWTERAGAWLVPGCGYGNDAAALAQTGATSVQGQDLAPSAIAGAQARYGKLANLTWAVADFFAMPQHAWAGRFDGLWEHTCFCAIAPTDRPRYVAAAAAALRPGGLLVACFYLEPWDADEDQTQGPPFRSEEAELNLLFSADFVLENSLVPPATFPGREGREQVRFLRRQG